MSLHEKWKRADGMLTHVLNCQVRLARTERTASKPRRACVWSFCTDCCKKSRKIARTLVCAEVGLGGHVCVAHCGVFSYFRVVIGGGGGQDEVRVTRESNRFQPGGCSGILRESSFRGFCFCYLCRECKGSFCNRIWRALQQNVASIASPVRRKLRRASRPIVTERIFLLSRGECYQC